MQHILLTNDDGINSEGLLALEEALQAVPAQVWVVAPGSEMSASSHSISLRRPVHYEELSERKFAVAGTPADSVIMALNQLLPIKPDLVIAGINKGGNMGENVLYSGTVAAALEAALSRVPAFAISVASRREFRFEVAAAFAVRLAEKLLRDPLPTGLVLNVNVPQPWRNGIRLTRQAQDVSSNLLVEGIDPRGRKYFWIHEQVDLSQAAPDSDYAAIQAGSMSVTPLSTDRTEHMAREQLAAWAAELDSFALAGDESPDRLAPTHD